MSNMTPNINALLTQLRHAAPDGGLDQLEPQVWIRIAAKRPTQPADLWRWRAAVAAAALAIGAAAGGAATARPSTELALFSSHAALAPSTLLEFTK